MIVHPEMICTDSFWIARGASKTKYFPFGEPFRCRFSRIFPFASGSRIVAIEKRRGKQEGEEKDKSTNPLEEAWGERFDLSMGLVIDTASPPREKDCLRFDLDAGS